MPNADILTPREASHIATNAYFALKGWIDKEPVAGVESRENVINRVLGPGDAGKEKAAGPNPTLKDTGLAQAKLGNVHTAKTGFGVESGFGYTLMYKGGGATHAIIAMRGTRPEMAGKPDLITDLRAGMTGFADYGAVHKGFKRTFESALPGLDRENAKIMKADVIHCVGHSLGGAVATLVAGHYASRGKAVKLYTFGSPRVGAMGAHNAFHERIGKQNIYRVAHDLDPISLIGPYPYIHVNPAPADPNNMTLPSPSGALFSTANHDMAEYIRSVGDANMSWGAVRGIAGQVDHDNALLARWLLHGEENPSWLQYASAKTLTILFKLFSHVLRTISTSLILGLSVVDLLAEMLVKGLYKAAQIGQQIFTLLRYAAVWAGIKVAQGADFTAEVIKAILAKMLATLQMLATQAILAASRNLVPVGIGLGTAWALHSYGIL